jgi:hypothetical protein
MSEGLDQIVRTGSEISDARVGLFPGAKHDLVIHPTNYPVIAWVVRVLGNQVVSFVLLPDRSFGDWLALGYPVGGRALRLSVS